MTPAIQATPRYPSVLHALHHHAVSGESSARVTVLLRPGSVVELTHRQLLDSALRCATALRRLGVGAGDRVMLVMPTTAEAIVAFFAIQLLGAIPVPMALPGPARRVDVTDLLAGLCRYLRPRAVIAPASMIADLDRVTAQLIDLAVVYGYATDPRHPALPMRFPEGDECALIQCTSGSTGVPKGAMITHTNLAVNSQQIADVAAWTADDVWAGWLPLYHDMGLVGGLLTPVYIGSRSVMMSPSRFLRAPADWLRMVHRYSGTISASPNFGLGYLASRVRDDELADVDLSSWRMIFCGAEQVRWPTTQRFLARLADRGLAPGTVIPCYGLAEASLVVTASRAGQPVRRDVISRRELALAGQVVDADPSTPDALEVVEVGRPVRGTEVRVVDRGNRPLPDCHVGGVQFRGPSRTAGYYGLPEKTAAQLDAEGWWSTGDVGYLRDGSLRITGREQELIVIRGANYSPTDFEQLAESVDGVAAGGVVAVGHCGANADSEELCLVVEVESPNAPADLEQAIKASVVSRTGVLVSRIVFVPKRAIPKTTSGKAQRALAYQQFVAGDAATAPRVVRSPGSAAGKPVAVPVQVRPVQPVVGRVRNNRRNLPIWISSPSTSTAESINSLLT
jgi:fatty-acyl-CoA synthase